MTTLVIDVGSSSVRALLFDGDQAIAGALARLTYQFTPEATADPVVLRASVEACIDAVLTHPAAPSITAVGMATFVGNLLGVVADGVPVTPLFTYADTRSTADAADLLAGLDMAAIHARTGCRIHPAYHPAKLRWLARTDFMSFLQAAQWTDFATYCYSTWFGRPVPCSYSTASWSGLLDRHTLTWDAGWLDALGVAADVFPALADVDTVQIGLSAAYADRWPTLRDVPFYLSVGDGAAANLGSGGIAPDYPVLTVGTTAALRIVTAAPPATLSVPTGLWAYRVDAPRSLIGGATSEGGNVFAWARTVLQLDPAAIEADLAARLPGAGGVIALPLLAGERSPGYRSDAVGTLHGLRLDTRPIDMLGALLDGLALRLRVIYTLLGTPGAFVLAGGGALTQSPALTQSLADALGVPLYLVDAAEATARGVALLIAERQQGLPISPPPIVGQFAPRPDYAARYDALQAEQTALYHRLYGA